MPIEHISDTARWVAVYRAMESERPDAIFRDPYARRLAGDRGEEIVRSIKRGRASAWAMIVRTALFDELIRETIAAQRIDTVVNLAAGLDARPWRMELPPALHWVDVDLPAILAYKTDALRAESPRCRYEAVATDLTDDSARHALFARIGEGAQRALVVTEGLLIYLTAEHVAGLARDLHEQASFAYWLIDLANPWLLKYMNKSWGKAAERGNAPFRFAPAEGTKFFEPCGWREAVFRSSMEEAHRLHREMTLAWLWRFMGRFNSARRREEMRRISGTVLLERTGG
ncbi:MAG TPA: class I SAM-dependent methyltransferase [Gemmatimonadaceae bacterium]